MQTIAQNVQVMNYLVPATRSNDSSLSKSSCTYFSMKGYNKATVIVNAGAMTEASTIFKAYQATAVASGTIASTALSIPHYWTNKAAVTANTLVRTTASSDQMAVDSTNNATYMFEIDAKQLNATSAYDCVGIAVTGLSAATCLAVTVLLHDARYAADGMPINARAN